MGESIELKLLKKKKKKTIILLAWKEQKAQTRLHNTWAKRK